MLTLTIYKANFLMGFFPIVHRHSGAYFTLTKMHVSQVLVAALLTLKRALLDDNNVIILTPIHTTYKVFP
jgi:hypothetical protein